jgi:hypothetical protein
LLFATSYAIGSQMSDREPRRGAWRSAAGAIIAFAAGGALTVIIKQVLALAVLGTNQFQAFVGNLQIYTSPAPPGETIPDILRPFAALYHAAPVLAYGSHRAMQMVVGGAVLAWVAALALAAMRARKGRPGDLGLVSDWGALAVAAAVIVAWILVFPTHTFYHARFMVRILVAPVALGMAALGWTLISYRRAARGSSIQPRPAPLRE